MAAIETNVDGMNAIFPRNEPDGVLVYRNTQFVMDVINPSGSKVLLWNQHVMASNTQ